MKKQITTNTFSKGLSLDFYPAQVPNDTLTNCLNGTLITYNGNEFVLQNDMGNGRVETAYLPEGYVPVGTTELGGIIYIVSYNPFTDKCQIGSFPSPERNITTDELVNLPKALITNADFQDSQSTGNIKTFLFKVNLLDPEAVENIKQLNPGDKYAIYCKTGQVTGNKDCLSEVGNSIYQFNINPRNLTIHVVSVSDDGKITYLDDSLKWDFQVNGGHYYIKELKSDTFDQKTDIDSYRSLVSSAYNVFNSRVSGTLALLCELEVAESFSVTWDAEVTGDEEKNAEIYFAMNWTSQHSKINPKWAILTESTYSKSWKTDKINKDSNCELPSDNRKNDGSDADVIAKVGDFKYNPDDKLVEYEWTYEVTPAMKFGKIPYLAKRGTINFLDIGSGKMQLTEWRYYIQDSSFYLSYGFSIYPEKNKKVDSLIFTFIPFWEVSTVVSQLKDSTTQEEWNSLTYSSYPQMRIDGRYSYAGGFQELILFEQFSRMTNDNLHKNNLYLVDIALQYGQVNNYEYRHFYRWLYTTTQWNQEYLDNQIIDFNELYLDNVLTYDLDTSITDNIKSQTDTIFSEVAMPKEMPSEQPYGCFHSMVTAVNYNNGSWNTGNKSWEVAVKPKMGSYSELFQLTKPEELTYSAEIQSSDIELKNASPTYEKPTRYSDIVLPELKEPTDGQIKLDTNFGSTVQSVIQSGISKTTYSKVVDQLEATVVNDNTKTEDEPFKFGINVKGALFSKIIGLLEEKICMIHQTIKPLIFNKSDLDAFNFNVNASTVDFHTYFLESHHEGSRGAGFQVRHWIFTDNKEIKYEGTDQGDKLKTQIPTWNELQEPRGKKKLSCQFYVNFKNQFATLKGVAILGYIYRNDKPEDFAFIGKKKDDNNMQNTNPVALNGYMLWIGRDDGDFLPILSYKKSDKDMKDNETGTNRQNAKRQELARYVLGLIASLYGVDARSFEMKKPVVDSVIYISNYQETFNVTVQVKITNMSLGHVSLVFENNTKTLEELKTTVDSNASIGKNNITLKEAKSEYVLPNIELSHIFTLINDQLYDILEKNKATEIAGMAYYNDSEEYDFYDISKRADTLYLHFDGLFTPLVGTLYNHIYKEVQASNVSITNDRVLFKNITSKLDKSYSLLDALCYTEGKLRAHTDMVLSKQYGFMMGGSSSGSEESGIYVVEGCSGLEYISDTVHIYGQ